MTKKLPIHCDYCGKPFQKKDILDFGAYNAVYLVNPKNRHGKPVKKHWCRDCGVKNTVQLPNTRGRVITTTMIKDGKDEDIYEFRVLLHPVKDIPGYDFYRIDIIATHLPTREWASFIRNLDIEDAINYRWNIRKCIHASKIRGIICDVLFWATSDPQRCYALLEEDRKKRKWNKQFYSQEPCIYQICVEAETSEYERNVLYRSPLFRSAEACIEWVIANRLMEIAEIIVDKYPHILKESWEEYEDDSQEILDLCKQVKEWLQGDEGEWFLGCNDFPDGSDPLSWDMKYHVFVE